MKLAVRIALAAAVVALGWGTWSAAVSAQGALGTAASGGFSLPYRKDGKLAARFSGGATEPLSTRLLRVRQFRVETYRADELPDLVGEAPECVLDLETKSLSSAGPLKVTQAGGRFTLAGEGFNWDQATGRLELSNKVHTTLRLNPFRPAQP